MLLIFGSLDGKGVWGEMDTCISMSEFLCYLPQIVTTLLVHYTPDIKFLKKLGKLERPIETPDSGKRNVLRHKEKSLFPGKKLNQEMFLQYKNKLQTCLNILEMLVNWTFVHLHCLFLSFISVFWHHKLKSHKLILIWSYLNTKKKIL